MTSRTRRVSLGPLSLLGAALLIGACGEGEPREPRLDPRVERQTKLGGNPSKLAVGDDAIWVLDASAGTAREVDPATGRPRGSPVAVGSGPAEVAIGAESVWVASADDSLTAIGPGRTAERIQGAVPDPAGIGISHGSVWVGSRSNRSVRRFDELSGEPVGEPIELEVPVFDLAADEESVWVALADGALVELDAQTGEPGPPIEAAEVSLLAVASDGEDVWVVGSDQRLGRELIARRIEDGEPSEPAPVAASNPVDLAVGEGGAWVTLAGSAAPSLTDSEPPPEPGVQAVSAPAADRSSTVKAGARPTAVAVGGGMVWVVSSRDGLLSKIAPGSDPG